MPNPTEPMIRGTFPVCNCDGHIMLECKKSCIRFQFGSFYSLILLLLTLLWTFIVYKSLYAASMCNSKREMAKKLDFEILYRPI